MARWSYYGRRYYGYPRYNGWKRYNGTQGRVMARRASRPAPYEPFRIEETEPSTKRVWDVTTDTRYITADRSTRSSVVKLSYNFNPELVFVSASDPPETMARPLSFTLNDVPGFSDYASVYSQYRIIRGELVFGTTSTTDNTGSMGNYLVVSSQPFAQTAIPVSGSGIHLWVPPQPESTLRQTRWQRIVYPDSTTTGVRVGFRPYTMAATQGPSGFTGTYYQRVWHGASWTPFTWATDTRPITYFGPYVWRQTTTTDTAQSWTPYVTVILYLAFKGQK